MVWNSTLNRGLFFFGAEQVLGKKPEFVIDYEGIANSELYMNYQNNIHNANIPHLILEGGLTSMGQTFLKDEDNQTFENLNKDIDIVCAVPICSGLSQANATESRGSDAVQNNNMLGISEFVLSRIKPKVYIFENAPALYTSAGEGVRNLMIEKAKKFGYSISFIKTNTMLHGMCQHRSRTFAIFWQGFKTPKITFTKKEMPKVLDVIANIPPSADGQVTMQDYWDDPYIKYFETELGPDWTKDPDTHWPICYIEKHNTWEAAKKYGDERYQKKLDHIKSKLDMGKSYMTSAPMYLGPDKVNTIFAKTVPWFLHPTEKRFYTLRECMRFMGMPDDFPIDIKDAGKIGQNVPVCTAHDFVEFCVNFVNGKYELQDKVVDYIDLTKEEKPKIKTAFTLKK